MSDDMTRTLSELAGCLYGIDGSAFNHIDAVLLAQMARYTDRMGTFTHDQIVALKAIVELSTISPELARQYMAELDGGQA